MTGTSDKENLQALLRQNLDPFIEKTFRTVCPGESYLHNWHLDVIAWHLALAAEGQIKRLIINLPPRSLKSICASVALPAWMLGRDPRRRILCVSYSEDLGRKHARDCRAVMEADWYKTVFPKTRIDPRKNTEHEVATTGKGFRLVSSVGGTLTGRGGEIIIIDDPIKPQDAMSNAEREKVNAWYDNTLYSRLDNKNEGVIVIVMQRLHVDDLVGHVLGKEDWTVIELPAIAEEPQRLYFGDGSYVDRPQGNVLHPERESEETLDRIRRTIGSVNFAAQYQQRPLPEEGNKVKRQWFRRYKVEPPRESFELIVQSWDTASETGDANDYSVATTWGVKGKEYYLLDVRRDRWSFPDLVKMVVRHARHYQANAVLVEAADSGRALHQTLVRETDIRPIAVKPRLEKATRLSQQSVQIEQGRVYLPEDAPWLAEFEREVLSFPLGRHDDQVDSMTQFLAWAAGRVVPRIEGKVWTFGGSGSGEVKRDRYFERTGCGWL